ncbi:VOC family protein [Neobacillus sp. 114]|uniref:VOC family protein n=1 Tax=Neobacillus sp. 114 TaxID=3048535 RepID=UPI0024C4061F|nr:VOC family protein [Neobacillus sp. 114]
MTNFIYAPEIAKLGHVALVSANIEKSLWFFKEILGLEETAVEDGTHYLRGWGDFEHHSLSIRSGDTSYIDHIGWKAKRRDDLEQFASLLEEKGTNVDWIESGVEKGQGRAIRFQLPSGHKFEIYYDMEKPKGEGKNKTILKNQSHKAWAKGISARRIDHVNIATNAELEPVSNFITNTLGFKIREYLVDSDDKQIGAWMSVTNLVHDLAIMKDPNAPTTHQMHHLAFWLDNAQDMLRAADILSEHEVEFVGPGKHGISQAIYLYVIDPGSGLRIELFSNGYLIFEPDWEPIKWTLEDKIALTYWGENTSQANRSTIKG